MELETRTSIWSRFEHFCSSETYRESLTGDPHFFRPRGSLSKISSSVAGQLTGFNCCRVDAGSAHADRLSVEVVEGACKPAVLAGAMSARDMKADSLTQFLVKPMNGTSGPKVSEVLERRSLIESFHCGCLILIDLKGDSAHLVRVKPPELRQSAARFETEPLHQVLNERNEWEARELFSEMWP